MTNTLLISEKYVKTQSNIQDNVWGDFLTPAIREAQDIELQPIIGRPLYKKILKEVEEKDVEERFKTLIEDWIQPYLLYQTIVSLIPIIGTKLGNIGTVISNDEHVQNLSSSERENLEYRYRYLADHYKSELQKYLLANKDLYPELTSTCLNNLNLKSSNSLPLWTGGVRHGQRESTDCPDKADYADPDGRKAGYIEGGKTVTITENNSTTTVLPSEGYDGISSVEVEVNVPIQDKKTVSVTENNSTTTIVPDEGYDGISIVDVDVNVPIQDKKTVEDNVNIPAGGSQTVVKTIDVDEGYEGMKSVDVTLNVSAPLDKIPLIDGQKLAYFENNDSKLLPTDIFDFSNIKDFSNMFYENLIWNRDWSNITFESNNFSNCFYLRYGISKYPKMICLENTTIESFADFSSRETTFLNFVNSENIINFKSSFKGYFIYYSNKDDLKKNLILYNEEEILKRKITYKVDNMFSNLKWGGSEVLTFDLSFCKYLFYYSEQNYYSPFFVYDFAPIKDIVLDLRNVVGNSETLKSANYLGFLLSDLYFSKPVNKYYIYSVAMTDTQYLQSLIDALPQNTTSRTIQLSSNTMNALTDEMKATAANKNWTLTT